MKLLNDGDGVCEATGVLSIRIQLQAPIRLRLASLDRVLARGYKTTATTIFLYGSLVGLKRPRFPSACLGLIIKVASLGSPIRAKLGFSSYAFKQKNTFCIIVFG